LEEEEEEPRKHKREREGGKGWQEEKIEEKYLDRASKRARKGE
jgi:hypothetical protein